MAKILLSNLVCPKYMDEFLLLSVPEICIDFFYILHLLYIPLFDMIKLRLSYLIHVL